MILPREGRRRATRLRCITGALLALGAPRALPASAAEEEDPPEERLEPGAVPVVAYNSDAGLGLGLMANLASFRPGYDPYLWRVQLSAVAFHGVAEGDEAWPLVATALALDLPDRGRDGRLRLNLLGYYLLHNNSAWYGLGNGTTIDPALPESHYWYHRRRFGARGRVNVELSEQAELFGVLGLSWTEVTTSGESRLDQDAADPRISAYLAGLSPHLLVEPTLGLSVDTRDHEFWPTRGHFSEVSVRATGLVPEPTASLGLDLTTRAYLPLAGERLSLAGRFIADGIVGDPPFYELSRFGGSFPDHGPGGQRVGRGYALRRYHGKIKLLATLEARSRLIRFDLAHMRSALGPVAFFDLGRVWADWRGTCDLDGGGVEYSGGAGLRLHWGESFVVRVDLGFSPEGRGVYLGAGHVF